MSNRFGIHTGVIMCKKPLQKTSNISEMRGCWKSAIEFAWPTAFTKYSISAKILDSLELVKIMLIRWLFLFILIVYPWIDNFVRRLQQNPILCVGRYSMRQFFTPSFRVSSRSPPKWHGSCLFHCITLSFNFLTKFNTLNSQTNPNSGTKIKCWLG